jgi:flavin-dependent dehydrogenase
MSSTIVLGAGPTGLAAGMMLARDGHRVTILERDGAPVQPALRRRGSGGRATASCSPARVIGPPVDRPNTGHLFDLEPGV